MVEKFDELEDRVSWIQEGQADGTRTSSNSVGMVRHKWLLDGGNAKKEIELRESSTEHGGFPLKDDN